ncbi:MAG: hypothetical protein WC781_05570 [Candidatus Pacearchaeota archaeon]|jgi:hypothetical protein
MVKITIDVNPEVNKFVRQEMVDRDYGSKKETVEKILADLASTKKKRCDK